MQDGSIQLIVENKNHIPIIYWILEAANYPLDKIEINAVAKSNLKTFLQGLPPGITRSCAVLVNCDAASIPEALDKARRRLGYPFVRVFCAIPEVETWLFADEVTAQGNAKTQWGSEVLPTLPLPEDIKSPKSHAELAFGKTISSWEFVKDINVDRAEARSFSLRNFLQGLDRLLADQPTPHFESVSRNISRDVFAGLIGEIIPATTVIWKTATGELFTAEELRKQIEEGTEIGQQYASDVLRVARDFMKRKANRKGRNACALGNVHHPTEKR